jgi:hypothetical protein
VPRPPTVPSAVPKPAFIRLLMLRDEAALAGIDRWPLQPGEPEPIARAKKLLELSSESR